MSKQKEVNIYILSYFLEYGKGKIYEKEIPLRLFSTLKRAKRAKRELRRTKYKNYKSRNLVIDSYVLDEDDFLWSQGFFKA